MKLINIYIAIISDAVVLTYILTGFDFLDKERLTSVTQGAMYIIFILSLAGVYASSKRK